jgi:hypothetical protein
MLAIVPAAAIGQETEGRRPAPISKRDLTRMLVGDTYERDEIAGMIRRACLSFVPTVTERELFRGLGAEGSVLSAIDGCLPPPAPVRAQESELPVPPSQSTPATFASPSAEDVSDPAPIAEDEVSDPAPAVEEQVPDPAALAEPSVEPEAPAPTPIIEVPADTILAADSTESRTESSPVEAYTVGPSDEVSRLRRIAAGAAARGDVETALRTLRDIVSLAPDDPLTWFQLGAALASVGDAEGARDAFIRAATLDRAKRRSPPND